ncbi:MAG TPA: tetratricopeptide repeat protein [Deltaproteobacteria bacterium]|nr:tetratricopeptide repeat protein [Deltaproteobacteria bacterium]
MSSIYDALKRVQEDGPKPEYVPVRTRPERGRRTMWLVLIAAVIVSSLATGAFFHFWGASRKSARVLATPRPALNTAPREASAPMPKAAPDPAALLAQARERRRAGDNLGAIDLYEHCLRADPAHSKDAYVQLAGLYFERGDIEHAVITYNVALTHFRNDPVILNNLGGVLLAKGDIEGALGYFRLASNVSKDYVEPVYNMACAYARKGNQTAALEALNQALSMHPDVKTWAANDPDLESLRGAGPVNVSKKGE